MRVGKFLLSEDRRRDSIAHTMNAINVIYPYKRNGIWAFDDPTVGLNQEPFVADVNVAIDRAVAMKEIANAEQGFRAIFSAGEFPGYDLKFDWLYEGNGGNWYRSADFQIEGWMCPALFKYFDTAPKELYVRFEAI
jgi:hypothetical protein